MKIILFTHPSFLGSQSMPRYAKWISEGMKQRGHEVEIWSPEAKCYNWPVPAKLKKWMGYIDQYILFPRVVRTKLRDLPGDTLFVFADQALGPWIPLVAMQPHVIHCHDFLAQRIALGEIPNFRTGTTGRWYQAFIRRGYQQGKYFISISKNTKKDLHRFLKTEPLTSEIVYNGLTQDFFPSQNIQKTRKDLGDRLSIDLSKGYILHVGGNQWYKNRPGVIEIYDAWRRTASAPLPLLMVGAKPSSSIKQAHALSEFNKDIHLLAGCADDTVKQAYAGASLFVFPSFEEGFGWPLIEAMASGCPVLTTDAAPMNEIGAQAVIYIQPRPADLNSVNVWAEASAEKIETFLQSPEVVRNKMVQAGIENIIRFDAEKALDMIEGIYKSIIKPEQA